MRRRSAASWRPSGPPAAAWTVPPAARAVVTPAVAARTVRLDGRAVFPVLPVLLSGTCTPSGDGPGGPVKETAKGSPISGKFLPVKGMRTTGRGAAIGAEEGAHRWRRAAGRGAAERVGQRSQPAAKPTPHHGDSSGSSRVGRTGAGAGSRRAGGCGKSGGECDG